jgi:hypothetical protein
MLEIYVLGVFISFLIGSFTIVYNLKEGYDCTLKDLLLLIISSASSFVAVVIFIITELQENDSILNRITVFKGFTNNK